MQQFDLGRRRVLRGIALGLPALAASSAAAQSASATSASAVNSGGGAVQRFASDAGFTGGTAASYPVTVDVSATPGIPSAIFTSERWGEFEYVFQNVPPGSYDVCLYFAEIYFAQPGARKFAVVVNGNIVLHEFGIIEASGGQNKALVVRVATSPDYLGRIRVSFVRGSADFPKVSAIAIDAPACAVGPPTLFSPTSFWNARLTDSQAINPNSSQFVSAFVAAVNTWTAWLNTTEYSTGLYRVDASTPRRAVAIVQSGQPLTWTKLYAECQKGVPVPEGALPAAGTDGHITILDTDARRLYEFWQLRSNASNQWQASWGGILDNVDMSSGIMPIVKNAQGGDEYWGATATSLPAIGGTILLDELRAGVIPHALAFAIPNPKNTHVWPALRSDGVSSGVIPEGARFRFPSSIVIEPGWAPITKLMVAAIRDFGAVLRDRSGSVSFYGEDPTQYGTNPYRDFYGGLQLWDVMKQFPWSDLVALA